MKIRQGFVSNSSSASFIINWMWDKTEEEKEYTPAQVIAKFMDIYPYSGDMDDKDWNAEKDEPIWRKSFMYDDEDYFKKIKGNTVIDTVTKDKIFLTTTFDTSMNNCHPDDFGESAKSFLMAWELKENGNFILIKKQVRGD